MSWEEPLEWITTTQDGNFLVVEETAALVAEINQPLTVVAVAGLYRTGKSYLMNRMAGKSSGFALGSTVQSKTKGIWIWCIPHPMKRNETLVLIDTEGLGDPEKGSEQHDMTIFSLAVLLSSTFIFNAIGKIDQDMIDKLYFVTELTERIKVKSSSVAADEESTFTEFTEFFPNFVLAVRDFTLELELNGQEVTADEYFNHILALKKGMSKSIQAYNLPREAIRNAFKSHNCFVFTRPVQDEKLFPKLAKNDIPESQLSTTFLQQSKEFCKFILHTSSVKKLKQGIPVNGQIFRTVSEEYVKAINSGAVPCIESTVTLVAERENNRIVESSLELYKEELETLSLPTTADTLDNVHNRAYEKALDFFRGHSVFDDNGQFFDKVTGLLRAFYAQKLDENEVTSIARCSDLINQLFESNIATKLEQGQYACIGGYKVYYEDIEHLLRQYEAIPEKGVKAEEVRVKFLRDRTERDVIMAADSELSEKQKQIEVAKNEKKLAELEARAKDVEVAKEKERCERLQHDHQMQIVQMQNEYQRQQVEKDKEMKELIEARLAEQDRLLTEGFDKRAAEMNAEINSLRQQSKPSAFESFLGAVSSVANTIGSVMSLRSLWRGAGAAGGRQARL